MVGKEEWKEIRDYEGRYMVSNFGNVISCERYVKVCGGGKRLVKEKKLKQSKCSGGYSEVNLWKDNSRKMFLVHRLVAEAFLENKNKLPEVNHKDENKENNRVDNLEWCDAAYNNCYGTRLERVVKSKINGKNSYPVIQKIDNKVIETFPSLREVQRRTGYNKSLISKCCKGIYKQAYGYNWEFVSK